MELTLRIFFYGLMLFVPVDERDPTMQKDDGAHFAVLMIDERHGSEKHEPVLAYEQCEDGEDCVLHTRKLAVGGGGEFERIWFEWSDSPDPHACPDGAMNRVCRNDSANGPVRELPTDRTVASDFDWIAPLGEILGHDRGTAKVREKCLDDDPTAECDHVVARVDLAEGGLRTCTLVRQFEDWLFGCRKWVKEVTFVGGAMSSRAVAESLVLERTIAADSLPELKIRSSLDGGQPLATLAGRDCGGGKRCIDIILFNAPLMDKSSNCPERGMMGEHFKHYARLLEMDDDYMPIPVVLDDAQSGRERDHGPRCEFPSWASDARRGSQSAEAVQIVRKILTAEDRAICPVGTP